MRDPNERDNIHARTKALRHAQARLSSSDPRLIPRHRMTRPDIIAFLTGIALGAAIIGTILAAIHWLAFQ